MGDWFSNLVDAGLTALSNDASKAFGNSGTSAHIPAQNQVVANFGTVLNQMNAGTITPSAALAQIQKLDAGFTSYCQSLGYQRALQGARDVHNLAVQVESSIASANPSLGVTVTATGVTASNPLASGITLGGTQISFTTLALVALAGYALYKQKI